MKTFARIFSAIFACWCVGIFLYVLNINSYDRHICAKPEAVVVLTGGSNRIEEGLDIMRTHGCSNLFISGVNRDVSRHDILGRVQKNSHVEHCDLELGYTARNTHENAQEVLAWLRKKEYKAMVLVTAHYHMPRSLLEFRAIAPDIHIIPYAVYPSVHQKTYMQSAGIRIWLVLKEFHKYLAACFRIYVFHWWT